MLPIDASRRDATIQGDRFTLPRSTERRPVLARAGIDADGKIVLQYYPESVVQLMLRLQQQFQGLEQSEILPTVFGIRRTGDRDEPYVIEQIRR